MRNEEQRKGIQRSEVCICIRLQADNVLNPDTWCNRNVQATIRCFYKHLTITTTITGIIFGRCKV